MDAIVLIGPIAAGKTTMGRLLAGKLGVPFCPIDDVRPAYYQEAGYDQRVASAAILKDSCS
jgi:shikimate kinase